ncbi:SAM-dependent methyltransferase [Aneurinibacillus sp. BA2021]|nr:SAM-dependent methyltransferase [Aneurinibacillus sp. BA2021]
MIKQTETFQPLELDRFVFLGRTWEEYVLLFDINEEELHGKRILDCPGGACSFTATANQKGLMSAAVDLAYYYSIEDLEKKGQNDIDYTLSKIEQIKDRCCWTHVGSMEQLREERTKALTQCIHDMKANSARYVPAVLPLLPFSDEAFDITLSAHFLFMYADKIDHHFHLQTLEEMMRVTREEIRIFPTTDMNGRKYEQMDEIKEWSLQKGWEATEHTVPYEFHKNANTMLKLRKKRE